MREGGRYLHTGMGMGCGPRSKAGYLRLQPIKYTNLQAGDSHIGQGHKATTAPPAKTHVLHILEYHDWLLIVPRFLSVVVLYSCIKNCISSLHLVSKVVSIGAAVILNKRSPHGSNMHYNRLPSTLPPKLYSEDIPVVH